MGSWGRRFMECALACALFAGCVDTRELASSSRREPSRGAALRADATRNVVLVTLDGVRWQEIFGGVDARLAERAHLPHADARGPAELLPNIRRLFFARGTVLGDPGLPGGIEASGPHYVSMPGYLELLRGATTPCRDNACDIPRGATLLDDVGLGTHAGREEIAAITSWEALGKRRAEDPSRALVRAGRGAGDVAPAYPGDHGYRPDHETAALAIEHLLTYRPRFLWISLGDTDEWAHRRDYRGYLAALQSADALLGEIAAHLEEMGDYGASTALLVTTDHGRDESFADHGGPSSARVWLLGRGARLPRRGAVGTRATRYLRDVAPTIRAVLGLAPRACDGCGRAIEELVPDGVL